MALPLVRRCLIRTTWALKMRSLSMATFDCRHSLYSTPNFLLLARNNNHYKNGSCSKKFGPRASGAGDEQPERDEAPVKDNNDMQIPSDCAC